MPRLQDDACLSWLRVAPSYGGGPCRLTAEPLLLQTACVLLLAGWPAAAVAEVCGYSRAPTFFAAFRAVMGMTPGEYREGLGAVLRPRKGGERSLRPRKPRDRSKHRPLPRFDAPRKKRKKRRRKAKPRDPR